MKAGRTVRAVTDLAVRLYGSRAWISSVIASGG
jgi:hypothetical protein